MHKLSKLLTYTFCLGTAIFLSGCGEKKDAELKAPLREVRTTIVEQGSGIYERNFSGALKSSNQVSYSFKVSGSIERILVEVGQTVKKDDVIAVLDTSTYELEVQREKASLLQSESEFKSAKANFERTKKLYEAGDSSRSALDDARAESETTGAAAQAAQKSLQIAQQDLSYTKLRSTSDCQIASIPADSGENVSAGTEVITASCGEGIEVKLNIPESVIGNIKKDMAVQISLPAIPGKTYQGIVKEVGVATVDGGTTFPVDILITDTDKSELKSGLSANVTFSIDNRKQGKDALPFLPSFAVGEDQSGRFVFVVENNQDGNFVVKRTPVVIGDIKQNGIEIVTGIAPGMTVVTAGVSVLRDGMEVKVSK